MRQSNKVSKKLKKLSKSKLNYRKDERRVIHRRERRQGKVTGFGSEKDERDYLNSDITRYYADNR